MIFWPLLPRPCPHGTREMRITQPSFHGNVKWRTHNTHPIRTAYISFFLFRRGWQLHRTRYCEVCCFRLGCRKSLVIVSSSQVVGGMSSMILFGVRGVVFVYCFCCCSGVVLHHSNLPLSFLSLRSPIIRRTMTCFSTAFYSLISFLHFVVTTNLWQEIWSVVTGCKNGTLELWTIVSAAELLESRALHLCDCALRPSMSDSLSPDWLPIFKIVLVHALRACLFG